MIKGLYFRVAQTWGAGQPFNIHKLAYWVAKEGCKDIFGQVMTGTGLEKFLTGCLNFVRTG